MPGRERNLGDNCALKIMRDTSEGQAGWSGNASRRRRRQAEGYDQLNTVWIEVQDWYSEEIDRLGKICRQKRMWLIWGNYKEFGKAET